MVGGATGGLAYNLSYNAIERDEVLMTFRENLLHLRAANNMTQEQLAVCIGVSRQSVAKWESGKAYPEMDKLIKLAETFECTIDDLVRANLSAQPATDTTTTEVSNTAQDTLGYDCFMRRFATRIANGVFFIIFGVACSLLLFPLAEDNAWIDTPKNLSPFFAGLGLLVLFAGIVLGLATIIPAGMQHSEFVKEHPYLVDFYTKDQKDEARTLFTRQLIAGIASIFLGVCAAVFLSISTKTEALGAALMLSLIAVGVRCIVHGCIYVGRVNIAAYNQNVFEDLTEDDIKDLDVPEKHKEQLLKAKQIDKRKGAWCGAIMLIATIAGLVMLFVPQCHTAYFWLSWTIGGIACALVNLLFEATNKD